MSEQSEPVQIPSTAEATEVSVSGEIFADESGKEVFSAFEKLGEELNNLTENLERQFEDDEGEENLGDFDFKTFIASSVNNHTGQNVPTNDDEASKTAKNNVEPDVDGIIALLNEEQDREEDGLEDLHQTSPTQKGHVKRDSTGGMSIDADSIASGGSHVSKKISALINSMRIRSLSLDESSAGGAPASSVAAGGVAEEWENDDDCGYTVITLSEEEFFDYEEVRIAAAPTLVVFFNLTHPLTSGNQREDPSREKRAGRQWQYTTRGGASQEGAGARAGGGHAPVRRHVHAAGRAQRVRALRERRLRGDRGGPHPARGASGE
jgi:hypothetical protein